MYLALVLFVRIIALIKHHYILNTKHYTIARKHCSVAESFNVMMARAEDKMEDMFFTGGDFKNQGFLAWRRIL